MNRETCTDVYNYNIYAKKMGQHKHNRKVHMGEQERVTRGERKRD